MGGQSILKGLTALSKSIEIRFHFYPFVVVDVAASAVVVFATVVSMVSVIEVAAVVDAVDVKIVSEIVAAVVVGNG